MKKQKTAPSPPQTKRRKLQGRTKGQGHSTPSLQTFPFLLAYIFFVNILRNLKIQCFEILYIQKKGGGLVGFLGGRGEASTGTLRIAVNTNLECFSTERLEKNLQ